MLHATSPIGGSPNCPWSVILRARPKKVFLMIRNLFSDDGDIVAQVGRGREGGMKGDGSGCSLANNAALCGNREDSDKGKKEGREE